SFSSAGAPRRSYVRNLYEARLEEAEAELHIYLSGSGFLYNMVRIIAGTLVQVGEGKTPPGQIPIILEARNRRMAGPKAPAQGLALWEVGYPEPYAGLLADDPAARY